MPSEAALAKRAARGLNRAAVIDANFLGLMRGLPAAQRERLQPHAPIAPGSRMTAGEFVEIFRHQLLSRHLDLQAREMRARNEGFYTIGSSGHEANAVLGFLCRETDPAFLHYRSGGFMMARLAKDADRDPVYETCLSLAASSEDPVSGGRHKVWGSDRKLWVLPQTSTIASHLPKAVGAALGLEEARRIRRTPPVPADSIVLCSFGDASTNHATALAGFNAAQWAAYQRLPVPVLFVCEDNGIGISVSTPAGWIEAGFSRREGLDYFAADGTSLPETFEMAARAVEHCRKRRRPTFLHLKVPRLLGHAGTDWEGDYMEIAAIEANEARDPLLAAARLAVASGCLAPDEVLALYEQSRTRVAQSAAPAARDRIRGDGHDRAARCRGGARRGRPPAGRRRPDRGVRRGGPPARGRATAPPVAADQPRAARPDDQVSGDDPVRRGRGAQGRRLHGDRRAGEHLSRRPRLQHAARRDHDPRPRAGCGIHGTAALPRDPVPGLLPQRLRPGPRRGLLAAVFLGWPVGESHGHPHRRPGLPERLRRALSQRQFVRGLARHPRTRRRLPLTRGRCGGHAAHGRRPGEGERPCGGVP